MKDFDLDGKPKLFQNLCGMCRKTSFKVLCESSRL